MEPTRRPNPPRGTPSPARNSGFFVLLMTIAGFVTIYLLYLVVYNNELTHLITYDEFWRELKAENITEVKFQSQYEVRGKFKVVPDSVRERYRKDKDRLRTLLEDKPAGDKASENKASAETAKDKIPKSESPAATTTDTKAAPSDAGKETSAVAKTVATSTSADKTATEKTTAEKPAPGERPLSLFFAVKLTPVTGEELDKELRRANVKVEGLVPDSGAGLLIFLYLVVPVILLFLFWLLMSRMRDQMVGGGILGGFSRSPAKRYDGQTKPVTFADVAGLEGVKNDLQEVVEFLKNPQKFARLGGRIPKGVLLFGPPGTGKTLLARAVAGEAGVPFFSISGSEFIQMFVGVGASRVRDLFRTAKEASPAILFIDEIDAVGRHRGAGLGGGNDEREQTLNQILSEMDGFSQNESVIVMAATNRPDVLDPALLRPGRFDRHITVDRPNVKARLAMFKVHCREVPLAQSVDLDRLAAGTVGLTGADIRNLVNEAALWATRNGKSVVEMDDFEYARDKVLMGPKREEVLAGREKTMTAYHEAGHALLAWILPGVDRVHKVTIVPRGRALGVTQLLPEEDRLNIGQQEIHNRLIFIMGGRAAEKLIYGEFSAGAENDLSQATKLARRMVSNWGMSERIGPVSFRQGEEHPFLGKEIAESRDFSEHTAKLIDEEITRILQNADQRALELLREQREKLDKLAAALEEREILDDVEIAELIGPAASRTKAGSDQPTIAASSARPAS